MEWQYYYNLEPFGAWRDNYHSAQIAMILANQNRKRGTRPHDITSFFYVDKETATESRDEATLAWLDSMVS